MNKLQKQMHQRQTVQVLWRLTCKAYPLATQRDIRLFLERDLKLPQLKTYKKRK